MKVTSVPVEFLGVDCTILARSDLEKSEALVISLTARSRFLIFDDSLLGDRFQHMISKTEEGRRFSISV